MEYHDAEAALVHARLREITDELTRLRRDLPHYPHYTREIASLEAERKELILKHIFCLPS